MFPTPMTTDAPDHGGPPNKNANTKQWGGVNSLGQMAKQGLWPTVTVNGNRNRSEYLTAGGDGLETAVKRWRTPQAGDHKISGNPDRIDHPTRQEMLADQAANWPTPGASRTGGADSHGQMPEAFRGGLLNPRWVEWLMGIPIGWTGLGPLATESYRQLWRGFLNCSEGSND